MDEFTEGPGAPAPGVSLRDRIARRSRELEQKPEHIIMLDVPGYEDLLAVHYRALPYREQIKIEGRSDKVKDPAEQTLRVAADKLIAACERIVEKTDDPDTYTDTGFVWNAKAADLFDKQLPEGSTARQALIAIIDDEEVLVRHAADLEEQRRDLRRKIDQSVEGNSVAS